MNKSRCWPMIARNYFASVAMGISYSLRSGKQAHFKHYNPSWQVPLCRPVAFLDPLDWDPSHILHDPSYNNSNILGYAVSSSDKVY